MSNLVFGRKVLQGRLRRRKLNFKTFTECDIQDDQEISNFLLDEEVQEKSAQKRKVQSDVDSQEFNELCQVFK